MDLLGKQVKDKITGFEGIVTSHVKYITGCDQYGVAPKVKDGVIQDTNYFDATRLEITGPGITKESVTDEENPGGVNRDAPRK